MKTLEERKINAVYHWLLNQGTPSRIASLVVHTWTWEVINMVIEDEGIKIEKNVTIFLIALLMMISSCTSPKAVMYHNYKPQIQYINGKMDSVVLPPAYALNKPLKIGFGPITLLEVQITKHKHHEQHTEKGN